MAIKIYIAQPMQYVSRQEIVSVREDIEEWLSFKHSDTDIEFINSYNEEWEDIGPLAALGRSLELLSKADVAYFAPGWRDSRGCQIEACCCELYNIPYAEVSS